ncbi:MAG TPA: chemotaxis protein CheD [Thermoanaerobaculia bacterium]|nr:chemotaxis protein CheD [Thermoanaerobaculia bacterium]
MAGHAFMAAEEAPENVYLHPGQLYVASHSVMVSTILGSCVAVCLWDPAARVGGMNHFLLPSGKGPRYANDAMTALVDEMTRRGAFVARMVAKVFGGACVIAGFTGPRKAIGAQNAEAALQFLNSHSIPVRAEQTGGSRGRKLLFHTGTGQAYVKEI